MILDLRAAAGVMGATGTPLAVSSGGWSVDTRTQNPGDVFFALRGPNHDGHAFVRTALEKGAAAVVVDHASGAPGELVVRDTLASLQQLAAWARKQWNHRVVGVTGSAGKTTTKDAIAHLLAAALPVGKTIGNLNNLVGMPLSILRLPDTAEIAVLEMGMNHAGEIRELGRIAAPDIGVVTNVGYAHVEAFDSIDGVAAAKRELIEALPPDGIAVLNADDPRVVRFREVHPGQNITFGFSESADVRACRLEPLPDGARFQALGVDFETSLVGHHAVMNLLAAIAVARVCGIAPERLREPVRGFTVGKMRGERLERNGVMIWNDCYNSNPEAVRSMLDVLRDTPARRRIAVLGEMLELGSAAEQLHREVGRYAARQGIDFLIGVRGNAYAMIDAAVGAGLPESAAFFFEDATGAGEFLRDLAQPGDAILFKGSRGVAVERALERLLAPPQV
ncbi:MAG TPA: UDP-N-acetylmuramoyl-tripeptide--D-alanyl-D-alanine ligase [Bryobacteraceae bacterium]|nr:UDP-N-acetylmuramoyl-tripeptide--D-alanyl-D-alanine ligase [Bryobacteraceae bacterium]